jgi:hypothetical protein
MPPSASCLNLPKSVSKPLTDLLYLRGRLGTVAHGTAPLGRCAGGASCWVVERTLAWLHRFRRLALRYERRADSPRSLPHARLRPPHLALPEKGVLKRTLKQSACPQSLAKPKPITDPLSPASRHPSHPVCLFGFRNSRTSTGQNI